MNKEINCNNFIGLLVFLRRRYGDDGVRQVLNGLVANQNFMIADKDDTVNIMSKKKLKYFISLKKD